MDLVEKIKSAYIANFEKLSFANRYHFASRLYLWSGDKEMEKFLQENKENYIGLTHDQELLKLKEIMDRPDKESKNAKKVRDPYLKKYPKIKQINALLFRNLFVKNIYGNDISAEVKQVMDLDAVIELAQRLFLDVEALSILSTFAINLFYNLNYLLYIDKQDNLIDPKYFLDIAKTKYNLDDPKQIQLLIYLLTHAIIGESQFYTRKISNNLPIYIQMIEFLENIIDKNFSDINLDNKFEFLVCCKICQYKSKLENIIYSEAKNSLSKEGTHLVDRLNTNPQVQNLDIDKSEHRNVLFIMSNSEFIKNS